MSYEYLTNSGVIVPDTGDTRQQIVTEWKQALGQDLNTNDETPQGLLINAETEARQAVLRNNAAMANQINPNIAEGVFLDALWALTGGSRVRATHTQVVDVLLTGIPTTIIPEGSIASAGDYQFKTVSQVILNAEGLAKVNMQSIQLGAIPCPIGTLNKIVTPILGWETINNLNEAIIGKEEETDQAARLRRKRTLALQSRALPEAIVSDLYGLEGVKSLVFRENTSHKELDMFGDGSFLLAPHSIWVCIDGGLDSQIAQSLLNTKSLGAGYNGTTQVMVTEPYSGQPYEIKFDRPEPVNIFIKLIVKNNSLVAEPLVAVRDAIINYAEGLQEGEEGLVIGVDVSPFEIASAINREYPQLFVKKVEVAKQLSEGDNLVFSTDIVSISLKEIAVINRGAIQVELV